MNRYAYGVCAKICIGNVWNLDYEHDYKYILHIQPFWKGLISIIFVNYSYGFFAIFIAKRQRYAMYLPIFNHKEIK